MEIQVGDYIRSKNNGAIAQLKAISNYDNKNKMYEFDRIIYSLEEETIINMKHILSCYLEKDILKHSKNIIDLIEVGDYVNGYPVIDVYEDHICVIDFGRSEDIYESDINLIVTKEQFKSVEYEVGE